MRYFAYYTDHANGFQSPLAHRNALLRYCSAGTSLNGSVRAVFRGLHKSNRPAWNSLPGAIPYMLTAKLSWSRYALRPAWTCQAGTDTTPDAISTMGGDRLLILEAGSAARLPYGLDSLRLPAAEAWSHA